MLTLGVVTALLAQGGAAEARQLLDSVAKAWKDAPGISFDCEMRVQGGKGGAERVEKASFLLKRPNLWRIETPPDGFGVRDGKNDWTYAPSSKECYKSRQQVVEPDSWCAGPIPYLFFTGDGANVISASNEITIEQERVKGKATSVIRWTWTSPMGYGVESRLWIDSDKKIRRYASVADGTETRTTEFTNLKVESALDPALFVFNPPEGVTMHDDTGGEPVGPAEPLSVGTAAPDFEAIDLEGNPVKLSSFAGKPILLNFWFYD